MRAHASKVRSTEGPRAMGHRPKAGGTPARTEGFGRVDSDWLQRSSIDIPEDDVYGSEDRNGICNEAVL